MSLLLDYFNYNLAEKFNQISGLRLAEKNMLVHVNIAGSSFGLFKVNHQNAFFFERQKATYDMETRSRRHENATAFKKIHRFFQKQIIRGQIIIALMLIFQKKM